MEPPIGFKASMGFGLEGLGYLDLCLGGFPKMLGSP